MGTRWHVYMVRCADGTLYTGVAIDVARRLAQHNGLSTSVAKSVAKGSVKSDKGGKRDKGARYTRARRPVTLAYSESAADRAAACRREYLIKRLSRQQKLALIATADQAACAVNADTAGAPAPAH